MKKQFVFEVFEEVAKKRPTIDKVKVLRENDHWAVKDIIRGTYDDNIQWSLPKGQVPYTASEEYNAPSNLLTQNEKFKYFAAGSKWGAKMTKSKKESLFIGLLEGIHPKDAELVVNMINKEKIEGLTKNVIKEAFPNLISE